MVDMKILAVLAILSIASTSAFSSAIVNAIASSAPLLENAKEMMESMGQNEGTGETRQNNAATSDQAFVEPELADTVKTNQIGVSSSPIDNGHIENQPSSNTFRWLNPSFPNYPGSIQSEIYIHRPQQFPIFNHNVFGDEDTFKRQQEIYSQFLRNEKSKDFFIKFFYNPTFRGITQGLGPNPQNGFDIRGVPARNIPGMRPVYDNTNHFRKVTYINGVPIIYQNQIRYSEPTYPRTSMWSDEPYYMP